MKIAVVDDDALNRRLFQRALAAAGHEIATFEHGLAAWEALASERFECVVTDWQMPNMTGVELCRNIRTLRDRPYTHVLIATSLSLAEHTLEAYHAGADDLVSKPCDITVLVAKIAAVERGQLAHAENALKRSLATFEGILGPEHIALVDALSDLATVYRRQRAYVQCRAFVRRQLAIIERAHGAEDPRAQKLRTELEELLDLEETV